MRVVTSYGVIPHGYMAGVPALWLRPALSGEERSFVDVSQILLDGFKSMNMHFRLIVCDVRESFFGAGEVGEVVQLLDWAIMNKIGLIHYVNSKVPPSYLRMGGFVKMKVEGGSSVNLNGIPVGELYWYPNGEQTGEPAIEGAEKAARYIAVNASFPSSEAYRFLADIAEQSWAVALPVKGIMEVQLWA